MKQLHVELNQSSVLGEMYDDYLKSFYVLGYANAKQLTKYLLAGLKKQKLKSEEFNRTPGGDDLVETPPVEIYEYQSFFMLERADGELTLLDGFRRLLWYNSPDHQVQVRVYKEDDLTDQQIMRLLIYLNHFKFYAGSGQYYDRGFSLALKLIFGLNIPKYYKIFNAYLTKKDTERKYWSESTVDTHDNLNVKERMLNPMFVTDMKFIESLLGTGILLTDEMGAMIYQYRTQYPDKPFDSKLLTTRCAENKIISDLQNKYSNNKSQSHGSEGQKLVNQLIPLYKNIFNEMFGVEAILTYAEKKDEVKKIIEKLKKDKTMIKLTGNSKYYIAEMIFRKRLKNKEDITFKCVIHPKEHDPYSWNKKEKQSELEHGLLPYEISFKRTYTKTFGHVELAFGFTHEDGTEFILRHNYGDNGKKYTYVHGGGLSSINYDCDVFVNITKGELDDVEKHRFDYKY